MSSSNRIAKGVDNWRLGQGVLTLSDRPNGNRFPTARGVLGEADGV